MRLMLVLVLAVAAVALVGDTRASWLADDAWCAADDTVSIVNYNWREVGENWLVLRGYGGERRAVQPALFQRDWLAVSWRSDTYNTGARSEVLGIRLPERRIGRPAEQVHTWRWPYGWQHVVSVGGEHTGAEYRQTHADLFSDWGHNRIDLYQLDGEVGDTVAVAPRYHYRWPGGDNWDNYLDQLRDLCAVRNSYRGGG